MKVEGAELAAIIAGADAHRAMVRPKLHDRREAGIDLGGIDEDRAGLETVETIRGLHRARIRAEDNEQYIGDNDRQRHQQQELRMLRAGDEGIDQSKLQHIAEREHHGGDWNEQKQRIKMEAGAEHYRDEHGDGHHLAVGEIDHAHHAEDDRQAERHQPVHQAGQNSADGDVEIDV